MSEMAEVMIIAEGASEQNFVEQVLAPYLAARRIYVRATQLSKKGQKGGDVKFSRAKRDIRNFLLQRNDLYVSTFIPCHFETGFNDSNDETLKWMKIAAAYRPSHSIKVSLERYPGFVGMLSVAIVLDHK